MLRIVIEIDGDPAAAARIETGNLRAEDDSSAPLSAGTAPGFGGDDEPPPDEGAGAAGLEASDAGRAPVMLAEPQALPSAEGGEAAGYAGPDAAVRGAGSKARAAAGARRKPAKRK